MSHHGDGADVPVSRPCIDCGRRTTVRSSTPETAVLCGDCSSAPASGRSCDRCGDRTPAVGRRLGRGTRLLCPACDASISAAFRKTAAAIVARPAPDEAIDDPEPDRDATAAATDGDGTQDPERRFLRDAVPDDLLPDASGDPAAPNDTDDAAADRTDDTGPAPDADSTPALADLPVDAAVLETLQTAGYVTLLDLRYASLERLRAVTGVTPSEARAVKRAVLHVTD